MNVSHLLAHTQLSWTPKYLNQYSFFFFLMTLYTASASSVSRNKLLKHKCKAATNILQQLDGQLRIFNLSTNEYIPLKDKIQSIQNRSNVIIFEV